MDNTAGLTGQGHGTIYLVTEHGLEEIGYVSTSGIQTDPKPKPEEPPLHTEITIPLRFAGGPKDRKRQRQQMRKLFRTAGIGTPTPPAHHHGPPATKQRAPKNLGPKRNAYQR